MDAAFNLGLMYETGDRVARDAVKARTLFRRAIDGEISYAADAMRQVSKL